MKIEKVLKTEQLRKKEKSFIPKSLSAVDMMKLGQLVQNKEKVLQKF